MNVLVRHTVVVHVLICDGSWCTVEQIRRVFEDNWGIVFVISPQNICCGYSLESRRGDSNEHPQRMLLWQTTRDVKKLHGLVLYVQHCWISSNEMYMATVHCLSSFNSENSIYLA